MSWSVSGKVKDSSGVGDLEPTTELGEGAANQLEAAKQAASDLIDEMVGEEYNVSLSGHSQSDQPDSSKDSISISISAI